MNKKQDEIENTENMGINNDNLSINRLLSQARKKTKKVIPNEKIKAHVILEKRCGRPYYYLVWYEKDETGKRKRKKRYLGTKLPPGYSFGKPVFIEPNKHPPETGVDAETNQE